MTDVIPGWLGPGITVAVVAGAAVGWAIVRWLRPISGDAGATDRVRARQAAAAAAAAAGLGSLIPAAVAVVSVWYTPWGTVADCFVAAVGVYLAGWFTGRWLRLRDAG